jgi:prephenate dehydrogenase
MSSPPSSVAIFGPGLMGASLLMALRERCPAVRLGAWARRAEALKELQECGLADFVSTDAAKVASEAELAVLCVPVDRLAEAAQAMAPGVGSGAVVTDVGSVKQTVVGDLEKIFQAHGNFVGSHPMCGSEEAGLAAARADLYEGALCVVTPTEASTASAVERVEALWRSVGARTTRLAPDEHDHAAALASHVPHVAAAALVELVAAGGPAAAELCAGGFRDTTRVAAGLPDLWTAILQANRHEVAAGLVRLSDLLQETARALENHDTNKVRALLESARQHRAAVVDRA